MMRILWLLMFLVPMSAAFAQDWPMRPVRVIVNAAPGGVPDVVVRLISPVLAEALKQPFVLDNRGGAEGYIGFEAAARAEPDGHTLLFSAGSLMMITPHLVQRKNFDPIDMFTPIAPGGRTTLYLVVPPTLPAKTLAEFIAYAKTNPGKMNFGSAGTGSGLHLAAEMFKREAGFQAIHVPYKGAGPALNDLLGGVFEFMFDPGTGLGQIKAGKLRLLGVVSSHRHPDFPAVPTLEEAGYSEVTGAPYHGFYAPKGISPAIVQRLNAEIGKAIFMPEIRRKLEAIGMELGRMSPDQFATYVRVESLRFGRRLREFGITKE